jgi:hypothetical protein
MVDPQPDNPAPDAWRFNTRAFLLTHKLSMQLRAAEDRINQLQAATALGRRFAITRDIGGCISGD